MKTLIRAFIASLFLAAWCTQAACNVPTTDTRLGPSTGFGAPISSQGGPHYTGGTNVTIDPVTFAISATGGAWTVEYTNPLSSLTGWTQQSGVWTVTGGVIQSDDGSSESFLSDDGGHPFDKLCSLGSTNCFANVYAVSVDVAFTASATSSTDCGIDLRATAAAPGNGHVRVFIQKDGTKIGADVFGGTQFLWAPYPSGAFVTGTYYTLYAQWLPILSTTSAAISIGVNGQAYAQGQLNISFGGITPVTDGPWANPAHCLFRNWKVHTPSGLP